MDAKAEEIRVTRFSGADWADQLRDIIIVGQGGIGSWLTLNLSRIGHRLTTFDHDMVDQTNVHGGQMFRMQDIGKPKVSAVMEVCREFGCEASIVPVGERYDGTMGCFPIMLNGLDNMAARRITFEAWVEHIKELNPEELKNSIYIDGRLTMEMFEVFAIQGTNMYQIEEYLEQHLFSDEEAMLLDCTTKQSTFGAMGIASFMTATLCNFLTNCKLDMDFREIPFYQRVYFPAMDVKKVVLDEIAREEAEEGIIKKEESCLESL